MRRRTKPRPSASLEDGSDNGGEAGWGGGLLGAPAAAGLFGFLVKANKLLTLRQNRFEVLK